MVTEGAKKRSASYADRRRALGWRQTTIWLRPDVATKLLSLVRAHGSQDAAISAAILALPGAPFIVGDRVKWKGKPGRVQRVSTLTLGGGADVDIRFDEASDDLPDWKPFDEVEAE